MFSGCRSVRGFGRPSNGNASVSDQRWLKPHTFSRHAAASRNENLMTRSAPPKPAATATAAATASTNSEQRPSVFMSFSPPQATRTRRTQSKSPKRRALFREREPGNKENSKPPRESLDKSIRWEDVLEKPTRVTRTWMRDTDV